MHALAIIFWATIGGGAAALLGREFYRRRAEIVAALRGDYQGPKRG